MKENPLSGAESLEVIQSMINKAKNHVSENGTLYLVWGWLVLICSLGQFILQVVVKYDKPYLVWMLTWFVVPYVIFILRRKTRSGIVRTYTDDILVYVWNTFVVLLLLSFFVLFRFVPGAYMYINIFVLLMYGMPTFLSGAILKFRPLIIGGVSCWILAFLSGYVNYVYHPLFISAAVIIAWIIPGYSLKAKYKKANS